MTPLLMAADCIQRARTNVLPTLREVCPTPRSTISSGDLHFLLRCAGVRVSKRNLYNYLRALEIAGEVRRRRRGLWAVPVRRRNVLNLRIYPS